MTSNPSPENTSIEEATIQIRTLNIGAKQMSLATFRQIIEAPAINAEGLVQGKPWGTVNYHPDRCDDAKEHLHVVGQLDGQLRRATVMAPDHAYLRHPLATDYVTARVHEGARRGLASATHGDLKIHRSPTTREVGAFVHVRGVRFACAVTPLTLAVFDQTSGYADQSGQLPQDFEDAYGRALRPCSEVAELLPAEAYWAAWRELCLLPQLFIGR